jgi:hypothetical protein
MQIGAEKDKLNRRSVSGEADSRAEPPASGAEESCRGEVTGAVGSEATKIK